MIQVINLYKAFGRKQVLSGANLEVKKVRAWLLSAAAAAENLF